MAIIPRTTQRQVLPNAGGLPMLTSSPSEGGIVIGKSLQNLGERIADAASQFNAGMQAIQEEDDQREYKRLSVEYAQFIAQTSYGDGTAENPGFLNLSGQNAVDNIQAADKAIVSKRKELLEKASNARVRDMFGLQSQQQMFEASSQYSNHSYDERKVANVAASEAVVTQVIADASDDWSNPMAVDKSIAAITVEMTGQAQILGWQPETLALNIRAKSIEAVESVITAAIDGNEKYAQSLLRKYSSVLDGQTESRILDKIHARERERISDYFQSQRMAEMIEQKRREENFKNTWVKANTSGVSQVELIDMVAKGDMDISQAEHIANIQKKEDFKGDGDIYLQTRLDIQNGLYSDPSFLKDERMDTTQKNTLLSEWNTFQNNMGTSVSSEVDTYRKALLDSIGVVDPITKKYESQEIADAATAAAIAYNNYLGKGKTPKEAFDLASERYRPTPLTIGALPKPKYWVGPSNPMGKEAGQTQVADTFQKLKEALANREITKAQYEEELEYLLARKNLIDRME